MFKSYLLPTMVIVIEVTHETENQYQWLSNIKNKSKKKPFHLVVWFVISLMGGLQRSSLNFNLSSDDLYKKKKTT
jgi:hypothetical protein